MGVIRFVNKTKMNVFKKNGDVKMSEAEITKPTCEKCDDSLLHPPPLPFRPNPNTLLRIIPLQKTLLPKIIPSLPPPSQPQRPPQSLEAFDHERAVGRGDGFTVDGDGLGAGGKGGGDVEGGG